MVSHLLSKIQEKSNKKGTEFIRVFYFQGQNEIQSVLASTGAYAYFFLVVDCILYDIFTN